MKNKTILYTILLAPLIFLSSCNKFLDNVSLPIDKVPSEEVFTSESMVASAVTGVLLEAKDALPIASSSYYTTGLYTDELKTVFTTPLTVPFYKNTIQATNSPFWSKYYNAIINANAALEGINKTSASLPNKNQWLGECYFVRAYSYFNLVNFYGDVPLALTTDYNTNNTLFRSPEEAVYKQIIADLQLAKERLPENYKNGAAQNTENRYRPNKAAATALLARVYLYTKDWRNAETEATAVIDNNNYQLEPLSNVFTTGNKETILAFANTAPAAAGPFKYFNNGMPANLTATQSPVNFSVFSAMSDLLYATFENGDQRKTAWVRQSIAAANAGRPETLFYFPNKYNSAVFDAGLEIPLRLAEQYLIRAEARAQLQLSTAKDDLNSIRGRAGLEAIAPADIVAAIARERQNELFTEGAHRFFDLKRTGKIDEVMRSVASVKETVWESYMADFPIPTEDIFQNPNIVPNPGYTQ